ncbi:MAG: transporter, partial [Actinomycetota bacterium]
LTVYLVDTQQITTTRASVVESMLAGQLYGTYGIARRMHLGLALPLVLTMNGEGLDPRTAMPTSGLSVRGTGDVRVELAYRLYETGAISVAAIPAVTLPTSTSLGSPDQWLGDDLPTLRPRIAAEWQHRHGKLAAAANLGFILRKQRALYSSEVGSQLTYGLAGRYRLLPRAAVVLETFGRKGLSADVDESPLEVDGGVHFAATASLSVTAGAGAGLLQGIGSPGLRVFAAVTYAPDFGDTDRDGATNAYDRCPGELEDKDGFQDDDGCPESDNDGDFTEDRDDKCPNVAEDKDGFDDEDGCPELDNDKDGFPDVKDKCPQQAEDKLPPLAADG